MSITIVQLINYTLSFLMWLIVGRSILRLIIGERPNVVALAFAKVTDPVYALARRVLPFVGERWIPVVSFFLLAAIRLALIIFFHPASSR